MFEGVIDKLLLSDTVPLSNESVLVICHFEEDETMAASKWYGTIYRWENSRIKFTLSPDHTVPEAMLTDIDFKVDMKRGFVLHDPDQIVERFSRNTTDKVAVLDERTLIKIRHHYPEPSVLYTCEVLVQDPHYGGIVLKSGSLLMRLPDQKLQCKAFQIFMAAALG